MAPRIRKIGLQRLRQAQADREIDRRRGQTSAWPLHHNSRPL